MLYPFSAKREDNVEDGISGVIESKSDNKILEVIKVVDDAHKIINSYDQQIKDGKVRVRWISPLQEKLAA